MKYDFDKQHSRYGTASVKWDQAEKLFGEKDVIPLWVADMDFQAPPAVTEALKARAEVGIYGYTIRPQGFFDAIMGWSKRRHQWEIKQEWLAFCPGIVSALSLMVTTFTEPGDKILIQTPVYPPFFQVIRDNDREIVTNRLMMRDGRYEIDFADLEQKLQTGVKVMLLCIPHNPVGRVWTREELIQVGELCEKYRVLVIADEIHCDLVYKGHKHLPFASLREEFAENSITCTSTAKTFNLAGLQSSAIIIPNPQLRSQFNASSHRLHLVLENFFAITAVEAAYNHGEEWLEELLVYLQGNLEFAVSYIQQHMSRIRINKPEGTYLVWLDFRDLGMNQQQLKRWMYREAKVALSDGSLFGPEGEGFMRLNIACPRATLEEGLKRIHQAYIQLETKQSASQDA